MIARERIERLFERAREAATQGNDARSRAYVRRAKRIAERHRLGVPLEFKRFVCDACDSILIPGRTARIRTHDGHVVITCECGTITRYPYE